ncbi:hypothetical protein BMS3Abin07_01409 [bacterium BMS3Abin07]|nr:hypothetical protein BMS3Abin07_01409 [bacterium BMS3Abin07]GBE33119.1 hypothetical protein BMS3Bbin05_02056 [bacterium BMS3Bbin05]
MFGACLCGARRQADFDLKPFMEIKPELKGNL